MYFMRKLLQIVLVLAAVPAYAWNVGTEATHKSVIIEEFTGIHCGNCPDGHKRAAALQRMHPDNLLWWLSTQVVLPHHILTSLIL